MSDTGDIPQFVYVRADGSKKDRREMEEWIRKEVPKVHWLRIRACKDYHLPKQISWDMREVVLRHWLLDEMVRFQLINGDILGVNKTSSNDEAELRQFVQRLHAMIHSGQAVQPQQAEGIDMSAFPPAPPMPPGYPTTPNAPAAAAPAFAPSAPPPMPPMPMAGPGPGVGMAPPPMPPGMGMAPPGYAPPAGPPMMASPGPQAAPPTMPPAPPAATAPTGPGRGRRKAAAPTEAAPPAPVAPPVTAPQQMTMAGPNFATPSFPPVAAPVVAAPPVPNMPTVAMPQIGTVQTVAAPSISKEEFKALNDKIDKLTSMVEHLGKRLETSNVAVTTLSRGIYSRQGSADIDEWLKELNLPNPSK